MGNNYFQMPEFNFRLRRALDPFGSQEPGRKFGGVSFLNPQQEDDSEGDLPDLSMGRIPSFGRFYDEEGPAISRYKSYLQSVPKPESYAPSKWRRLGAILSGTSAALKGGDGYSAAREIIRDPYETAYQDWARGGQGLKEAATMEEATAKNRASTYQKMLDDYMTNLDKGEQRRIGWANVDVARDRAETDRRRAEIDADYKAGLITAAEARNEIYKLATEQTGRYQRGSLGIQQGNLDERRRQGLDDAFLGLYNAETGRTRANAYCDAVNRPSYSSAGDMQRFEMDATREFLALNPTIADEVELDDYGRIDYESIDDPALRAQIMDGIKRGVANKQRASLRPGR